MAKIVEFNQRFRLNFTSTEKESGDTYIDIDINFENPRDTYKIAQHLQTFLEAAGFNTIEVKVK
jgi:hypothetical protein